MASVPNGLTPVDEISGGDEEDALLRGMAGSARAYITKHDWCPPITAMYFAAGVGGAIALFMVEFSTKVGGTENRLWIVDGDLPSAYLVVEPHDSAREALERYCLLMEAWVNEVMTFGDFESVFPVAAPRTFENADLLRRRLEFLCTEIVPQFPSVSIDG